MSLMHLSVDSDLHWVVLFTLFPFALFVVTLFTLPVFPFSLFVVTFFTLPVFPF